MATTKVNIEKTFPCALDGIGINVFLFKAGTQGEVPNEALKGLEAEGFISFIGKLPTVDPATLVTPVDPDTLLTLEEEVVEVEEVVAEEDTYDKAYFMNQGRESMIQFLTSEDTEITEEETDEELAEICAGIFADEED